MALTHFISPAGHSNPKTCLGPLRVQILFLCQHGTLTLENFFRSAGRKQNTEKTRLDMYVCRSWPKRLYLYVRDWHQENILKIGPTLNWALYRSKKDKLLENVYIIHVCPFDVEFSPSAKFCAASSRQACHWLSHKNGKGWQFLGGPGICALRSIFHETRFWIFDHALETWSGHLGPGRLGWATRAEYYVS